MALTKARVKVEAVGNVFFDVSDADLTSVVAPTRAGRRHRPGDAVAHAGRAGDASARSRRASPADYTATSTANVISTAGDATLSVADPSATAPGHLVNGTFVMPRRCRPAPAHGAFAAVSGAPATLKTYSAPVSNDTVTLGFRQRVNANDALRTGTYARR